MGDLYSALGRGDAAQDAYQSALDIAERLAKAEPDRTDYQRDLSVSFNKMGGLLLQLEKPVAALEFFQRDLKIAERLAKSEPDRADYAVDLAVSLWKVGELEGDAGRAQLEQALGILLGLQNEGRLAPADEPKIQAIRNLLDD